MDDLISRQAAIEAIQNLYPGMPRFNVCSNVLDRWYKTNKQYIECEDAINKLPSVQPEKVCIANIALSEEQVLEAVEKAKSEIIQLLPSKQSERKKGKKFIEIVVEYPDPAICTYPEYKGKPYFSIRYEEDGKKIEGFGTYNPKVLSEWIREYFIGTDMRKETDNA